MARARFVRPEFFSDETIGELPLGARLLFIAAWTMADLNGVLEWRPKQLRAVCFPHDEDISSAQVALWMDHLVALGRVTTHQVNAKSYARITHFRKHQSFTRSEIDGGARFPLPPGVSPEDPRERGGHTRGSGLPVAPLSARHAAALAGEAEYRAPETAPAAAVLLARVTDSARDVPPPVPPLVPPPEARASGAPAPSPTPAPTPAPSPSPGDAPAHTRTREAPGGDGGGARQRIAGIDPTTVQQAIDHRDPLAVVRAFGGSMTLESRMEWTRDAAGMQLGELAVVLWLALREGQAVRHPSGLRKARAAWREHPVEKRRELAATAMAELGLPQRPKAAPEYDSDARNHADSAIACGVVASAAAAGAVTP